MKEKPGKIRKVKWTNKDFDDGEDHEKCNFSKIRKIWAKNLECKINISGYNPQMKTLRNRNLKLWKN